MGELDSNIQSMTDTLLTACAVPSLGYLHSLINKVQTPTWHIAPCVVWLLPISISFHASHFGLFSVSSAYLHPSWLRAPFCQLFPLPGTLHNHYFPSIAKVYSFFTLNATFLSKNPLFTFIKFHDTHPICCWTIPEILCLISLFSTPPPHPWLWVLWEDELNQSRWLLASQTQRHLW